LKTQEGEQMPLWNQYLLYVELARIRREVPMEYDTWLKLKTGDIKNER
jgi:hypothetical protein